MCCVYFYTHINILHILRDIIMSTCLLNFKKMTKTNIMEVYKQQTHTHTHTHRLAERNRVWADKCRRLICQCQTPLQYNIKALNSICWVSDRDRDRLSASENGIASVWIHTNDRDNVRVVHELKTVKNVCNLFCLLFCLLLLITITSNFENWHLKWMWWKSFWSNEERCRASHGPRETGH